MNSGALPACAGGRPVRAHERFLVFGQPVLGDTEIDAVVDCLRRRWIGTGPKVHQFEQEFAAYRGSPHAVAVGSCTAALHLSILALGITVGDEVITTPMTFCATINAIIHTGATPVLADCDRWTQNLTAEAIAAKITPRTKAILVVHMCGRPCDMDAIMAVARRHKLLVVEDCAHAIEATIDGRPVGTFGNVGCFSFYATKNITTAEGGMVLTADEALADRIKILGLHGLSKDAWKRFADAGYQHYEVVSSGYKCNMTDLQAALGLAQLVQIEQFARRRTELWEIYNDAFADLPCHLPPAPSPGMVHAHHLYTPLLRLEHLRADRDAVLDAMTAENIGVGVHYQAITQHKYYRDTFGWRSEDVPNGEFIGARTLSLPLSAGLDDQDAADVCQAFRRILLHFAA
jgi:dTDP-4-amino-4,6-dideoxygalactose transaminase